MPEVIMLIITNIQLTVLCCKRKNRSSCERVYHGCHARSGTGH